MVTVAADAVTVTATEVVTVAGEAPVRTCPSSNYPQYSNTKKPPVTVIETVTVAGEAPVRTPSLQFIAIH